MQPRFGNRTTARPSRTRGTAAVSKIRCATGKTKTWRRPDGDSQLRPRRLRLHFVVGLRRGSFGVGKLSLRCANETKVLRASQELRQMLICSLHEQQKSAPDQTSLG